VRARAKRVPPLVAAMAATRPRTPPRWRASIARPRLVGVSLTVSARAPGPEAIAPPRALAQRTDPAPRALALACAFCRKQQRLGEASELLLAWQAARRGLSPLSERV
jgi:hypothetical protein